MKQDEAVTEGALVTLVWYLLLPAALMIIS